MGNQFTVMIIRAHCRQETIHNSRNYSHMKEERLRSSLLCHCKTIQQGPDGTLQVSESRHSSCCHGDFINLFRNFLNSKAAPTTCFTGFYAAVQ